MQLILQNKEEYDREFVYLYLPKYIYEYVKDSLDDQRCKRIDEIFNINSKEIILKAVSDLEITSDQNNYMIRINKNKRWKQMNLASLINLITYGNMSINGYNIIYDAFSFIATNINDIYNEWEES